MALDFFRLVVEAEDNARKAELARMEGQLEAMRLRIQAEEVGLQREMLEARVALFETFIQAARSSFEKKAELFGAIQTFTLAEFALDKRATDRDREHFIEILRDPAASHQSVALARRELARVEERARQLDRRNAKLLKQFQATIVALAPADYSQVKAINGLV